jgi:hypothetical protein
MSAWLGWQHEYQPVKFPIYSILRYDFVRDIVM